uniref:Ketimine reductase mu-crystallin n=1 Tax=Photinus pyralis TaxID=7054 RepID=A0A1Y1L5H3_PHOPY
MHKSYTACTTSSSLCSMSRPYEYLTEDCVKGRLTWNKAIVAAERALKGLATGEARQTRRVKLQLGESPNFIFIMCGYLRDCDYGGLVSLSVTKFVGNRSLQPPLPIMHSDVALMDENTGVTKAVIPGRDLTKWVIPSVSVVATKYLHGETGGTLAIIGAGNQGRLHAIALQGHFHFSKVRVWNRTASKAEDLVNELNREIEGSSFATAASVEECVSGADVIVTATNSSQTLVQGSWIKKGAHINAIGVSVTTTELDADTYRASKIYTDNKAEAETELNSIVQMGVKFECEVGDVIVQKVQAPKRGDTTIFQSSGTAVQYCAMARLMYNMYK